MQGNTTAVDCTRRRIEKNYTGRLRVLTSDGNKAFCPERQNPSRLTCEIFPFNFIILCTFMQACQVFTPARAQMQEFNNAYRR